MKVIQVMPNFGLAGAEIMCENLTYSLRSLGVDVIVVSLYDWHSPITERLEKAGIDIRYFQKKKGMDVSMMRHLYKLFKSEKPDVIHTHRYAMQYAIPAAIMAGVKRRVHTVHSIAEKENRKFARKLNKLFYKFAGVTPVALSDVVQASIVKEYKLKEEKIPIVLNGINLSRCNPKREYSKDGNLKILHIGRFSEVKNHKGLLKAFQILHQKYPDTELHLIGEGELKDQIAALAAQYDIAQEVRFLGAKSNVYEYLHEADVFTLPSVYEGIPMTLIEAMGTGLPIVATAVGGVPDMLSDKETALLTAVDENEIAKAFIELYENEALRRKLGENARAASGRFSSDVMAKAYISVYKNKR
ncbi:MAG: glycosyltransferase [Ruminococcaceae bacterium]|nr:glycosyltransferase [Oscillospiraceae bacterium]